ncbi:MAG: YtxH domain-containing protein [Dehalococcoidia bacterium]|nr:YtxH domain-containing protein [Dehalococcoidia bacterium]
MERDSLSNFALGLIVGAAIGAAVGLLYAPRSGKETRELLGKRASELRDKAEDLREKAGEYVEKARERAAELRKHGEGESA